MNEIIRIILLLVNITCSCIIIYCLIEMNKINKEIKDNTMKDIMIPNMNNGNMLTGTYFHTSKERMTKHYFDKDGSEIREYEVIKDKESNNMKLEDTIQGMTSSDYKERFIAEYNQVKIRRDKLLNMIKRYENKTLDFEPMSDIKLLKNQVLIMECYMVCLQERAEQEHIEL